MNTEYKMNTSPAIMNIMYARAHDLCRATNLRFYKKSWEDSDWSSYQEQVAAALLGLARVGVPAGSPVVETKHGGWTEELSVVTSALNEVMSETKELRMTPSAPAPDQAKH
jgi:hypothetical protein